MEFISEQKQQFVLTMQVIKDTIAFGENHPITKALHGLCDCWYGIAIQEGKTESEALEYTLDCLGEKMLSISK